MYMILIFAIILLFPNPALPNCEMDCRSQYPHRHGQDYLAYLNTLNSCTESCQSIQNQEYEMFSQQQKLEEQEKLLKKQQDENDELESRLDQLESDMRNPEDYDY